MRLVRQRNSALVCRLIQILLSYFASPCVGDGDGDGDDKSCTIPRDYTQYLYSNLFFIIRSKIHLFQFFTSTLFHFPLFIFDFSLFIFLFSLFNVELTLFALNCSYVRYFVSPRDALLSFHIAS
jgi:hypothetical protein